MSLFQHTINSLPSKIRELESLFSFRLSSVICNVVGKLEHQLNLLTFSIVLSVFFFLHFLSTFPSSSSLEFFLYFFFFIFLYFIFHYSIITYLFIQLVFIFIFIFLVSYSSSIGAILQFILIIAHLIFLVMLL